MFLDPPACVHRDKFKVRRSACVAKDSPRITDGELQRLVESKWQKDKQIKKNSNSRCITTCCLGGFQEISSSFIQKQTPVYPVVKHDCCFKCWLASMVRWNLKKSFLAANPPDGFGANPMLTVKYTAWSLMLRACFSAEGPGRLSDIMDSITYQQMKNRNLTSYVRNLIMVFHQDNDPNQTSKSTQKCIIEHKMKLCGSPLIWTL